MSSFLDGPKDQNSGPGERTKDGENEVKAENLSKVDEENIDERMKLTKKVMK